MGTHVPELIESHVDGITETCRLVRCTQQVTDFENVVFRDRFADGVAEPELFVHVLPQILASARHITAHHITAQRIIMAHHSTSHHSSAQPAVFVLGAPQLLTRRQQHSTPNLAHKRHTKQTRQRRKKDERTACPFCVLLPSRSRVRSCLTCTRYACSHAESRSALRARRSWKGRW